jgi:hypothetical protein
MSDDNGDAQRALVRRAAAPVSQSLRPQTFGELVQFADRAARSSMVPAAYRNKPDDIILAVQMGSEVGLAPMQALQNIAVIGGRPAIFGDAMAGLCRQSTVCDDIEEWFEGDGDSLTAFCKATRTGKQPVTQQFSVADAKKAGLWGKVGPWQQYPRRMIQMRARGFALRDCFPDVLRGLIAVEEAQDIPTEKDIPPEQPFAGTTLEHVATPAPVHAAPDAEPPRSNGADTSQSPTASPPRRTARQVLADLQRDADAALTEEDVDSLRDTDEARAILRLAEDHPARTELQNILETARIRVRVPPDDLDRILDGEPADSDALHAEALIALIRGAASAEAVGAILAHDMQANWLRRAMTVRQELAGQVIAARDGRIAELRAAP